MFNLLLYNAKVISRTYVEVIFCSLLLSGTSHCKFHSSQPGQTLISVSQLSETMISSFSCMNCCSANASRQKARVMAGLSFFVSLLTGILVLHCFLSNVAKQFSNCLWQNKQSGASYAIIASVKHPF